MSSVGFPFRGVRTALAAALFFGLFPHSASAQTPREIRIGLADGVPAARISAPAPFALRAGELVIETSEALVSPETEAGAPVLALGSFASEARAREVAESFREEGRTGPQSGFGEIRRPVVTSRSSLRVRRPNPKPRPCGPPVFPRPGSSGFRLRRARLWWSARSAVRPSGSPPGRP